MAIEAWTTRNGARRFLNSDAATFQWDDGLSGFNCSLAWEDGSIRAGDVGNRLAVKTPVDVPGVDGSSAAAQTWAVNVFRTNRDRRGVFRAHGATTETRETVDYLTELQYRLTRWLYAGTAAGKPFHYANARGSQAVAPAGATWWSYLNWLGLWHRLSPAPLVDGSWTPAAEPSNLYGELAGDFVIDGLQHLIGNRLGAEPTYATAVRTLREFGVGIRHRPGQAAVLLDLTNPTGLVSLAAEHLDGEPEEADGEEPYNLAGSYLNRLIIVPFDFVDAAVVGEYRWPSRPDSAPPYFVRARRDYKTAVVESAVQRNRLRLNSTRVTVHLAGCAWHGLAPGQGFVIPGDARRWRCEKLTMRVDGRRLETIVVGRLHQTGELHTVRAGVTPQVLYPGQWPYPTAPSAGPPARRRRRCP